MLCAVCVPYHFLFKFHKINTKISDYKQKCGMFYIRSILKYILSFIFLMSSFVIKKMNSFQFVFNERFDMITIHYSSTSNGSRNLFLIKLFFGSLNNGDN